MLPAQVNTKRARKGWSVVLVITNGGSDSTIGCESVDGDGSIAELTVSLLRTDEIGSDCYRRRRMSGRKYVRRAPCG